MASIDKRKGAGGDVVGWRVRWREADGHARSRQFDTYKLAKEFLAQAERCEQLGLRWEPPAAREEPCVQQVVTDYLTDRARTLSPKSLEAYGAHLNVLEQFLGARWRRPFREVFSRQMLAEFWAWVGDVGNTRMGRPRSAVTQNKILSVAQLLWSWADEHGDYGDLVPRPRRIDLPTPASSPTVAPTWAQMDAMLAALDEPHRRLAMVMRCTGLRREQARGLLWSDVDLERGELTVRGELGKTTQERRGRVVPLAPVLVAALAGWGVREGSVCPLARVSGYQVHQAWRAAGVPESMTAHRPLHGLRKGFVSGLKALGADAGAVEYLIGHSTGLAGTYTAAWALKLREAVALVPAVGGVAKVVRMRTRRRG